MEPAISLVLQALAIGAQDVVKDVASNETRHLYDWLKSRIQEKWVGKPDAKTILKAYEEDSESLSKEVLAQKLKESGIHQDKDVRRQAELLIQQANSSTNIAGSQIETKNDYSRRNSNGDTQVATEGARVSKHKVLSLGRASINEGTHYETTHNYKQTKLAVLFGLLTLALAGIIFYLIKTEKIEIPGLTTPPSEKTPPGSLSPSPSMPAYTSSSPSSALSSALVSASASNQVNECRELYTAIKRMESDLNSLNTEKEAGQPAQGNQLADTLDQSIGSIQSLSLSDEKLIEYQRQFTTLFREISQSSRTLAQASQSSNAIDAAYTIQALTNLNVYFREYQSLAVEYSQFCQSIDK
ncbi:MULTISPECIES: hypothetical protein [Trichocoleus]|uniref:Peroxin-14 n=1 Tax=Trichocoleus desertorum GB2-A4 TaxID=2933944 RepID=A0ABV0J576_9CYAN|nr:hypothetical protein [Trichocoleus sp. FACHB-46]MBD1863764.1 hypothetical protein [Trichocoleus sp. FACHB-46]